MSSRDKWSDLSLKDRAALIDIYVKSGITDLGEIRKNYNSFGDGGDTEPIYYDDTYIEPAVVKAFKNQKEYNRYLGEKGARAVRRGTNKVADNVAKALRYAPVVGDVMDGIEAYQDARSGNFKKAGVLAGLTLLPNAVEKPVRAVGKGLKNLRLYNRYVKDTKRFNEPMMYAFNGIKENYNVLKSNFPEMNTAEDVLRSMDKSVSTKFKLFEALRNRKGGYYSNNKGVWLNAYSPTRLKQAWKSPKKSIKALKGIAAHEGTHSALDNFNIPLSVRDRDYHKVIPGSVVDRKTSHLYNKSGRKANAWQNLPEEFIAEMNKVRYILGEKPGSSINSWNIDHSNRGENYLSRIFNFELGEAGELVDIYEGLGFANGGPIGEGLATYNHPRYNHDEEGYIYSYLISRGVPHTQASAIMGNIAVESMLDPHITQIGGGGGYGLIQATDTARKKNFINYDGQPYEFGSKLDPETQRQLDYIIDKGLNTYTTGEWRRTKNIKGARQARKAFLSAKDVETASNIFTDSYLRPGKPHRKRRLSISNFFDRKYKNPYEVKFMYE